MAPAAPRQLGWIIVGVVLLCALIIGGIALLRTGAAAPVPVATSAATSDVATPPAMHEGADPASADVRVDIYADYRCIWCARFEQTNGPTLRAGIADGSLSVTTHPVAILGGEGSFSQAAGAVAGCVVDTDPTIFGEWNAAMFAAQGPTDEIDLDTDTMVGFARDAGLTDTTQLSSCIESGRYLPWIAGTLEQARTGTLPGLDGPLEGTPTVLINGVRFEGSPVDVAEFSNALRDAQ